MSNNLFSFEGKACRTGFIIHTIIDDFIIIAIIGIAILFVAGSGENSIIFMPLAILFSVAVIILDIISGLAIALRRLHDMNRPGTHFLLSLVPLVNIHLAIILLFSRGTVGSNHYGKDPRDNAPRRGRPADATVRSMPESVRKITGSYRYATPLTIQIFL
jgi:uncharacterized membrane protein YhaH (DUF805 family)